MNDRGVRPAAAAAAAALTPAQKASQCRHGGEVQVQLGLTPG
jgi:hypothetical protein